MPFQGSTPEGRAAVQTATDATSAGNALLTLTIAQADTYIDNNVNSVTLAVVKSALKTIARLLILLRDRQAQIIADQQQIKRRIEALERR